MENLEHDYVIAFIAKEPYEQATYAAFTAEQMAEMLKGTPTEKRCVYARYGGAQVQAETVGDYKQLQEPMESNGQYYLVF